MKNKFAFFNFKINFAEREREIYYIIINNLLSCFFFE